MSEAKTKRVRPAYPAHVDKDIKSKGTQYANSVAEKGTVGHENAFYDYINGVLWGRNNPKK